jgi:hypothetical protein
LSQLLFFFPIAFLIVAFGFSFGFSFVFIVFIVFVAFVDFVVFAFGTTLTGSGSDGRGVLEGIFQALVGTGKMDQNGSTANRKSKIVMCDEAFNFIPRCCAKQQFHVRTFGLAQTQRGWRNPLENHRQLGDQQSFTYIANANSPRT